jgi:hypothetical protein
MRAVRLSELRELLQGPAFAAWWADLTKATTELKEAGDRHQEQIAQAQLMELRSELVQRTAMDAFSDGGLAEEAQAHAAVEAQELENRALTLVGQYEEQRFRSSDLWYRRGGAERSLEQAREAVEAAGRDGSPAAKSRRTQAEAALRAVEKELGTLSTDYAAEDQKRSRLWAEVEAAWAQSFERSLLAQEHGDRSRRIRREAERLFKEAEERRLRAKQLRSDADLADRERSGAAQRRAQLLERARQEFGCLPGDRFLSWRDRDDKRAAFVVSLVDDAEGYNVEVKALSVFTVGPQRGIAFLEPAREGLAPTAEEGDRRFEEYLLGPRRGVATRDTGPASGEGSGPA